VHKQEVVLHLDLCHQEKETNCFMYSFVDSQEDEFENQLVEEKVDVPRFSLLDDITDVVDSTIYDDYDVDF
jgi:hypothetical protein